MISSLLAVVTYPIEPASWVPPCLSSPLAGGPLTGRRRETTEDEQQQQQAPAPTRRQSNGSGAAPPFRCPASAPGRALGLFLKIIGFLPIFFRILSFSWKFAKDNNSSGRTASALRPHLSELLLPLLAWVDRRLTNVPHQRGIPPQQYENSKVHLCKTTKRKERRDSRWSEAMKMFRNTNTI